MTQGIAVIPGGQSLWFDFKPVIASYTDENSIGAKVFSLLGDPPKHLSDTTIQVGDIIQHLNGILVKTYSYAKILNLIEDSISNKHEICFEFSRTSVDGTTLAKVRRGLQRVRTCSIDFNHMHVE